jgi:hypothetical protein
MFVTDQQGTWVPPRPCITCAKASFIPIKKPCPLEHPESPIKITTPLPKDCTYPEALRQPPRHGPGRRLAAVQQNGPQRHRYPGH